MPTHWPTCLRTCPTCVDQHGGRALLRTWHVRVFARYDQCALQKLPHVTLLDPSFYHARIKPLLAEWTYLWLQKQHLHGIDREEAIQ